MKKIIKLTESDLEIIVKKVINEQNYGLPNFSTNLGGIKGIQQALINKGYSVGKNVVDGIYGPDTKRAIINYQKANGIKPTGIVGPITSKSLGIKPQTNTSKVNNKKSSEKVIIQKIKDKSPPVEPGVSIWLRKRFPNITQLLSGRELTSDDFTLDQKKSLILTIKNSQKRTNQQKAGSVDYIDYGQDVSDTFKNEKGSPSNWDVIWNSVVNNDRFAMATLFGKFSWVKNPDGSYTIDDKYDFKNPNYEQISGVNRKSLEGKSMDQLKKEYDLGSYEAARVKGWVDYPEEIPGRAIPLKIRINPSELV